MFYSQFILAKKGPLGRVWLASHWPKRLTKAHVFQADITQYVNDIINPQAPLALRLSGHLMLGVIRIYSRKTKYLTTDCNDALVKLKLAFKSGTVDLDRNDIKAAYAAVTLADDATNFDFLAPEEYLSGNLDESFMNTSRPEDITLTDDQFSTSTFTVDQGHFGGGFGDDDVTVPNMSDSALDMSGSNNSSVEVARAGAVVPEESFHMDDMEVNIAGPEHTDDKALTGKANESRLSFVEDAARPGDEFEEDDEFGEQQDELPMDNLEVSMDAMEGPDVLMHEFEETEGVANTADKVVPPTPVVLQPLSRVTIPKTNSKKRRLVIDRELDISETEMKQLLADTSTLVRTTFERPLRLCRRERLTMQRRRMEAGEGAFEMPSMVTLDERFHPMFKVYADPSGVKRRRLVDQRKGGTDAGATAEDGNVAEPEVARNAARAGDASRLDDFEDDIALPPQDDFDYDAGASFVHGDKDDIQAQKGTGREDDEDLRQQDGGADTTTEDLPHVPLDFDDDDQHYAEAGALPEEGGAVSVQPETQQPHKEGEGSELAECGEDAVDDGEEDAGDEYLARGYNKITVKVFKQLDRKFAQHRGVAAEAQLSFKQMAAGQTRLAVANLFHECLTLKTRGCIHTSQPKALGDIAIEKTDIFDSQLAYITAA